MTCCTVSFARDKHVFSSALTSANNTLSTPRCATWLKAICFFVSHCDAVLVAGAALPTTAMW